MEALLGPSIGVVCCPLVVGTSVTGFLVTKRLREERERRTARVPPSCGVFSFLREVLLKNVKQQIANSIL